MAATLRDFRRDHVILSAGGVSRTWPRVLLNSALTVLLEGCRVGQEEAFWTRSPEMAWRLAVRVPCSLAAAGEWVCTVFVSSGTWLSRVSIPASPIPAERFRADLCWGDGCSVAESGRLDWSGRCVVTFGLANSCFWTVVGWSGQLYARNGQLAWPGGGSFADCSSHLSVST